MKEFYERHIALYSRLAACWKDGTPLSDDDKDWVIKNADSMVAFYEKELQEVLNKEAEIGCKHCGGGCG